MNVQVFFEARPNNARASLQTFVSAAQYEEEAWAKANRIGVHRAMIQDASVIVVSYIDFEEALEEPEAIMLEALHLIRLSVKASDSVNLRWTSACPVPAGHTYCAFQAFNKTPYNFLLDVS